MPEIKGSLGITDFYDVIFDQKSITLSKELLDTVEKSHIFLKEFSKNKVIYDVNTGFGPMAQYKIKDTETLELQYNLIRSHASGTANPIEPKYVRAAILARLNTLSLGNSGVHVSVIKVMAQLLNKDIVPLIFEHGGVGASGDLVQLAHLALVLIGEGEVFYKGVTRPTEEVFKLEGIQPIKVELREGLGL